MLVFPPLCVSLASCPSVRPSVHRGCSELYRVPVVEYKGSNEAGPFEYKYPFRSNNNKWQRNSSSPQQSLAASPQPGHAVEPGRQSNRAVSLGASMGKTLSAEHHERSAAIPRSVSSDGRPLDKRCGGREGGGQWGSGGAVGLSEGLLSGLMGVEFRLASFCSFVVFVWVCSLSSFYSLNLPGCHSISLFLSLSLNLSLPLF